MERKVLDEFIEYLNSTGNPSVESFLRNRGDVPDPDRKELKDYYEYLFHNSAAGGHQPSSFDLFSSAKRSSEFAPVSFSF